MKKSIIESQDWILSKILSSEIPWEKTSDNGQYFLDVDPASFRIVLGILKGTFNISQDAPTLSRPELALLKSATRYLMLDDVHKELQGFETCMVEEFNAALRKKDEVIAARDEELRKREEMVKEAQKKANQYDRIAKKLSEMGVEIVKCYAYQTHRPFNECGARSIILCSESDSCEYSHGRDQMCVIKHIEPMPSYLRSEDKVEHFESKILNDFLIELERI